jgi:Glucodextranase, domain B/PASTA domain
MRPLALLLTTGLLLAGCGGSEPQRTGATPRVSLRLVTPDDGGMQREDRVQVRGTVSPADATVKVAGEDADVQGGEFTAEVPLEPGGNVIDISASSPGRRPATDAVRITRDMRVPVPRLVGLELDQAIETLGQAGLKHEERPSGSWLDRVIPGTMYVCAVEPDEETPVERQSTVVLITQREC